MTTLLEQTVEYALRLPEQQLDELSQRIEVERKRRAIEAGKVDAVSGRFATDEDVKSLFDKYRTP
jgi:predicted transcriptional regulator